MSLNPTSKNELLVLYTLSVTDTPLSITDLSFRTGLSYNTVKRVVFGNPRVKKVDGYPSTFTADKPNILDPTQVGIYHLEKPAEGWGTWLNQIRPLLVSITAISEDMTEEEIYKKATMIEYLGRSFLALSKDLVGFYEDPTTKHDWYHYFNWDEG